MAIRAVEAALNIAENMVFAPLRVWWFGYEPWANEEPSPDEPEAAADEAPDEVAADRFAVLQKIWGPGFLVPGGVEYVMMMAKPFGVNPSMSLLDLTAGLGGPSRYISHFFDVYITAMERVPEIARRGHAMSVDSGQARKAGIISYDPETVELKPHAFNCAFAEYLTVSIQDKERFFREVMRALKARGQFSFVDFVLAEGEHGEASLAPLRKVERFPPSPWRLKQYTDCLTEIGFDVRIAEDHTDIFLRHVAQAWAQFAMNDTMRTMTRAERQVVSEEANLWTTRTAAIQAGVLRVYRFYVISTYGSVM